MIADFIFAKAKLRYWLDDLRLSQEVWAPTGKEGSLHFTRNPLGEEVITEYTNTKESPKAIFFPPREEIFSYDILPDKVEITPKPPDTTPRVIFGMRPPDVRGLEIMDAYWMGDVTDERYKARRENSAIICVGYHNPPPCCFAESVGVDLFPEEGVDMLLTDLGRTYYVQVLTERGMALITDQFNPAESDHREDARKAKAGVRGSTDQSLELERWEEFSDAEILALPYWDEVYLGMIPSAAISRYFYSGTQFRFIDVPKGHQGTRYRVWTHPHAPGYSRLPDGDDYRPGMKERIRDWLLEMFLYFPKRHGFLGCSGAHRCVAAMPTKHDVRKIIQGVDFG
ncbi:4Fe-4S dicluster domain-containing protein [bacterium]|nr:4Fe-4S dicluster domain-containing protein [bacterium]